MPWKAKKEYQAWQDMMRRCFDRTHWNYPHYGGRGITVCDRYQTFDNLLSDIGYAPTPKHSLDRWPNNDGNYEPGNVRWATPAEQLRNRRNTLMVPWEGKMVPAVDLAVILGKDPLPFARHIWQRVHRHGYTPEQAIADLSDGRTGIKRRSNSTLLRLKGGPVITLQEACEQLGIDYRTVNMRRYRKSISIAEALGLWDGELEVIQEVRRPRKSHIVP